MNLLIHGRVQHLVHVNAADVAKVAVLTDEVPHFVSVVWEVLLDHRDVVVRVPRLDLSLLTLLKFKLLDLELQLVYLGLLAFIEVRCRLFVDYGQSDLFAEESKIGYCCDLPLVVHHLLQQSL